MSISKIFISDLEDNTAVETVFMAAKKVVRETKNGDPYLCLTLQDRTGTIEARAWDDALSLEARFDVNDFIALRGRVSSYRGELQITVSDVEKIGEDQVELGDYMPHSRWNADELFESLRELVDREVESAEVRRFLNALFDDEPWRKRYTKAPAAVANHHAYLAGLLEHSLSMARLAVTMGRHYNAYYPGLVDTDLLVAGCIIHDMAKTEELEFQRSFDYTTQGRLVGHIVRGAEIVGQVAEQLNPPLDDHLTTQLKHLVLSHHGKKEYGAPVTPKSPEALLLHNLDMIDSRMNMCWNACQQLVEDESDGDGWSDYQRLLGGFLYISGEAAEGWQHNREIAPTDNGPGLDPGAYSDRSTRAVSAPEKTGANDRGASDAKAAATGANLKLFGD